MDYPDLKAHLPHINGLRCVLSGTDFALDKLLYTNPALGEVATLEVLYQDKPQKVAEGPLTMWKQRALLPLHDAPLPALQHLGGTPLIPYEALHHVAEAAGVAQLCIKNDGLNQTGSLKDRASAMVVNHAVQNLNRQVIATASTGNAAAALAGICAAVEGAEAVIFVPADAPQGKIAQMLVFGAEVVLVDGDYDTAFDLCSAACQEFGWYNRSTGINPFTTEGKKTVAFEIAEQLNWDMPDAILVSVGDGSIIGGVHKGLWEMYNAGWIGHMPHLIGVQSSGSDALVHAWENQLTPEAMTDRPAMTVADSISSRLPRDRAKALRAVRETQGAFIRITDEQILNAIPELARSTGIFAEPAAAAAYAGLQPALEQGHLQQDDRVLLLITGNGLKDARRAMQSVEHLKPSVTAPTLDAVKKRLNLI